MRRAFLTTAALALGAKGALAAYGGPGVTPGGSASGAGGDLLFCAVVQSSPSYSTNTTQPCSLTLAGAIRVDGSGVTQPIVQVPASYQLLSNASASGSAQTITGGSYLLYLSGTFGGSTVTITATVNGVSTTLGTYTAAPSSPPIFVVGAGTSIQATVSGGSPSGLYASLLGVGSIPVSITLGNGNAAIGFVNVQGVYSGDGVTSQLTSSSQYAPPVIDKYRQLKTSETGSADPVVGISPVVTQAGTSVVGKASAGNLYSVYAVNQSTTAAYLVCINATAAPSASGSITPVDIAYLSGVVGAQATISYDAGPPNAYSTGITCLVTTSLTTYSAGGNAFMQARVR